MKERTSMASITSKENELLELFHQTGIDLSHLPPIMTTAQLAPALEMTVDALSQDRQRTDGKVIPYVKLGRRVRYLRADVCRYLLANRHGGAA
jgi:hypothetical protein